MRILVAEQDSTHRQKLVETIQKWGHVIEEALTSREVVALCRKKCPDLILADFQLPGEGGLELVRQIRQTGGHAVWVPLILLGEAFSESEMAQIVEAGADDILLKPINDGKLMLKVHSANRLLNLKEEVFKVAHELVVVNRALQNVIAQDTLTGIGNAESLDEAMEREWFAAKRSNLPISFIILNIDFFQLYNQTYGAESGDQVLKKIAECLKNALVGIADATLGRMIGDTFGVLLPKLDREAAYKIGEKLYAAVDALNIPHKSSGCSDHITVSFGVATVDPDHFTKPWDLKDAADFGLYQAKHRGRNRGFLVTAEEVVK
ncbi:MAG TPA: diguanylate cyclase [Gammaproteobacteria bacterium]|nr:diguanylate cyclase [Gammaproteobacteria bacterium]